ncbi:hypothetical protein EMPS_02909 [Entomortierella parvispora]|uniref:STB6-like N-terminal domain-containing protein n=1 Tax=Entomortierella parvispora TaxID=205924 RepID=A0A9P3H5N5_9FUNG|nr:hypothetical protein EMPS_02909 [Entomortierella parvispora]
MPLPAGSYVFCERGRLVDVCKNVDGIRIESTEVRLEGYQIYLVEQWAIERNREVATAVSFTGDPVHKIQVVAITIERPEVHCPRLEKMFDKFRSDGAKPKETPYGQLFVTNLSVFTSTLNIVLVPQQGDYDLYQRRFYLNLNLRRMGCSGRSALTSKSPSDAQREKFNQLYKISDSTDFEDTVIRLVDLVQNCLYIFGLFKLDDVDGLLCNATEGGLEEFYNTFLSNKFQKPSSRENVLDPNVLSGMFSKVANIRGKLQHLVSNVPKDPFAEPAAFVTAVKAFQLKKPDLNAGYLDFRTAEAITNAYQNSFNPQGLKVHKVLKSKIEDFSGMTAVNPEGETTDLEVFAKHINSESLKLVWRGKPKHKPDMADALANGDWLTGGKELGKSLVRGLAKTTRETKNASQSLKTMATGKNRQSLLLTKGKNFPPIINMKEGATTDDTLAISTPFEYNGPKSEDERVGEGYESEDAVPPSTIAQSTTNGPGSEDDLSPKFGNGLDTPQQLQQQPISQQQQPSQQQQQPISSVLANSVTAISTASTSSTSATVPALDALSTLFTQKPEPLGEPEIVKFYLDGRNSPMPSGNMASITAPTPSLTAPVSAPMELVRSPSGSPAIPSIGTAAGAGMTNIAGTKQPKTLRDSRKRAQSMSGLLGQERILGIRFESTEPTGSIPGISCLPYRKIDPHPARRKRTRSFACNDLSDVELHPLRTLVVECDTQRYYSYQALKEKEDNLKALLDKMQTIEKEFSGQLETLRSILKDRGTQFVGLDVEASAILAERRALLSEVREKEHATQRSVYHLDGMVGKLVEMRDFTGAFFNKISYLDTKLPVSQRRLALWMDKLQALQSQWFRTIGRYMIVYAPVGIRNRFVVWERDVQASALKAKELRGEVGDSQLGGSSSNLGADAMEYLRNLPSKSDAFTAATYERVRHEPGHVNRPYFSTKAKAPNFLMASSDENLVLDAMRRKKAADALQKTPMGFPPVPSLSSVAPSTWTSAGPTPPQASSPSTSSSSPSTALQIQQREQEQQQQFRRQRETGQEPGGEDRETSRSGEPQRTFKRPRIALSNAAAAAAAATNGGRSSGSSAALSTSSLPARQSSSSSSSSSSTYSVAGGRPFDSGDASVLARSRLLSGSTSSTATIQGNRSVKPGLGSSTPSSSPSSSSSQHRARPH